MQILSAWHSRQRSNKLLSLWKCCMPFKLVLTAGFNPVHAMFCPMNLSMKWEFVKIFRDIWFSVAFLELGCGRKCCAPACYKVQRGKSAIFKGGPWYWCILREVTEGQHPAKSNFNLRCTDVINYKCRTRDFFFPVLVCKHFHSLKITLSKPSCCKEKYADFSMVVELYSECKWHVFMIQQILLQCDNSAKMLTF